MNDVDVFRECIEAIQRHCDAYDYAMGRLDHETANRMIYDMQPVAGWYPLEVLESSRVWEAATDPEWGSWEEFPEAESIANEAAEYVAEQWEGNDSYALDQALERFAEICRSEGIALTPTSLRSEENAQ